MQQRGAKEQLLRVVDRQFYEAGISATGINTIIHLAGVARMSLYKHFRSKDDLIIEYLERRHSNWMRLHQARVEQSTTNLDRAMSVPHSYLDQADQHGDEFRGCGLLNAAGELQCNHHVRQVVMDIKSRVVQAFEDDLQVAGVADIRQTAQELFLILEGGIVHAGLHAGKDNILLANSFLERQLRAQLGTCADNPAQPC